MMQINTKAEFDQVIEKMSNLLEQYENNALHYNQYQFYLANGDRIFLEMAPQYIGHLLGIRLDHLRASGLFKNQDSYGLLKEFLENAYSVYQNVQAGHLSYRSIFSEYLEDKLKTFHNILYYFSPDEIEFVCKYDKSKIYQLGSEIDYPCDYFIAKKNKDGDIYILGLIRQSSGYAPMTSMLFSKDEMQISRLKKLLINQTLTYVNSTSINNMVTNFRNHAHMNMHLKLEKIKDLKKYVGYTSGASIDTSSEFQFALNGISIKETKINAYRMICQQMMTVIQNHEVFSLEQLDESIQEQLDDEIIQLIQTYNNEICRDVAAPAQTTYSELMEQYQILSKQVTCLNQQLQSVNEQSNSYYEQIQILQEENEAHRIFQSQIYKAVEEQKQKVVAP